MSDTQTNGAPELTAPLDAATMAEIDKAMGMASPSEPEAPAPAEPATPADPNKDQTASPNSEAAPAEEEVPEFTAVLRAREKAREEIQRGKSEAEQLREQIVSEAKAEAQKMLREAQEQAQSERTAWRSKFRESPLQALKEHGDIDAEQLVNEVVKEGSPEWKLLQAERSRRMALEDKVSKFEQWQTQQVEKQKQFDEWQARQYRERTLQEFVSMITQESAPGVRAAAEEMAKLAGPFLPNMSRPEDWLTLFGDEAHAQFVKASNGQVADLKKLVQHLEYQARGQARVNGSAGQAQSTAAQGQRAATGQRTLSAQSASERRAAPKRSYDMNEDELRAYMLEGVEEAIRGSR